MTNFKCYLGFRTNLKVVVIKENEKGSSKTTKSSKEGIYRC